MPLIERDRELGALVAAADHAGGGAGQLVFVGGDAGVGKTTLVNALVERVAERITVRRGTCDNVTTAAPLGALVDAVPELADVALPESGPSRLTMFRRLSGALGASPMLLVLEDVHWADEATLEMLRYLGRRIKAVPLMVVATFRDDALTVGSLLTNVLGDLATAEGTGRITLSPLSPAAVARLADLAGSDVDRRSLYGRTGGNPFYVTEVLAAATDEVPVTVQHAVLARVARLSASAQRVLRAAAVVGPGADVALLTAVSGEAPAAVDECVTSGMLVTDGGRCAFRHELARLAVEQTLAPGERAALHRSAFAALAVRAPDDDRRLAHHAAGAGDHSAVLHHATRAAAGAARLGAHREAAELYRLALSAPPADPARRIKLYEAMSYECYLTDQLEDALAAQRHAMDLAELSGDRAAVGAAQRWLSRLSWFLGHNDDSERYALRAVAELEPFGDGHELAMAYSNVAQLRSVAADADGAVEWGERALALARRIDDRETEMHALNNVGMALMRTERFAEGERILRRSLELARAADAQEHVARAYTSLGAMAVQQRRHADGARTLREGIVFCADHDLDSWWLYMSAWLARSFAEQGRLTEAETTARTVLSAPRLSPVTRVVAVVALGQALVRGGGDGAALLDDVLPTAEATGEAQRLVPVAAARAEAAWLAGRLADIDGEIERAWPAALRSTCGIFGELSWWSEVAGVPRSAPVPVAPPFAAMLAGSWRAAAAWWEQAGCPIWAATALARSAAVDDARHALDLAERVGASATAEALRRDRQAAGLVVPRGPRGVARANVARLTAREIEVLRLVADGLSNAEIAARLYLSEKTVGDHVSALLRKLGQPNRKQAASHARLLGILQ